MENFNPYERNTREPRERAPAGACDCHFHVFGDPARYPPTATGSYKPPAATIDDLERMHGKLGVERGVICQPTIYGTDHSLLIDLLNSHKTYRGTAVIDDSVSDSELERMNAAGVRGARFNFSAFLNMVPDTEGFKRAIARVAPLGWHIKIHGDYGEIIEHVPYLRRLEMPIVIDHLGRIDVAKGADQPGFKLALELLREPNWWMLLCNNDRFSQQPYPWQDTIVYARAFVEAAPDRVIWATDWPHVRYVKKMPNDADLFDLLFSYVPDAVTRKKILVDNPARLYGFDAI
jgi:predicted TIM-barrel fold metal-dependent hydrolase